MEVLNIKEACEFMRVSEPTLRKWIREDGLRPINLPKKKYHRTRTLFLKSELERWLLSRMSTDTAD